MNEERSCIGYSTTTNSTHANRVAGLLSLLYAQPFSVIIRLTADHVVVREKTVFLRLVRSLLSYSPNWATLFSRSRPTAAALARSGRSRLRGCSPGFVPASISATSLSLPD